MNQDLSHILFMYVFMPLMSICIIGMFVVSVREGNRLEKDRANGIHDDMMPLGYLNAVLKFLQSSKEFSKEDKQKMYKELTDFIKQYPHK